MPFHGWTLALQTVNFAVLVWLLHRFLYRPVLRMIDARRDALDAEYAAADAAKAKAAAQLQALEAERAKTAAARESLLKAAALEAERATAAGRARAEREAEAVLSDTRAKLAIERQGALGEAKQAALDLGADFARRLLAEVPPKLRAEAWIERIEQYLVALPEAERAALAAQLADDAPLTLITASALPSEVAEAWRIRLQRILGPRIAITFTEDAALIAGAELHLPDAVLRFSWSSILEALRAEVGSHDDAR